MIFLVVCETFAARRGRFAGNVLLRQSMGARRTVHFHSLSFGSRCPKERLQFGTRNELHTQTIRTRIQDVVELFFRSRHCTALLVSVGCDAKASDAQSESLTGRSTQGSTAKGSIKRDRPCPVPPRQCYRLRGVQVSDVVGPITRDRAASLPATANCNHRNHSPPRRQLSECTRTPSEILPPHHLSCRLWTQADSDGAWTHHSANYRSPRRNGDRDRLCLRPAMGALVAG